MTKRITEIFDTKQAVIFDLFHTLTSTETASNYAQPTADTLGIDRQIWNDHLMNKSKPRLVGKIKDPYTIIKTIADGIQPGIDEELIKTAAENRLRRFTDALLNIPQETLFTLQEIKRTGKKIALCSNADFIESREWANSPMAEFFDEVIFSCDIGYAKPDKEIFQITLDRLNVSPEDTMFVGDGGSSELNVTKQMGLTTVLMIGIIKNTWPHKIDNLKADADFIVDSISELVER